MGPINEANSRFEFRDLSEKDLVELSACALDARIWALNPDFNASSQLGFATWAERSRCDQLDRGHKIVVIRDTLLDCAVGTSRLMPTDDLREIEIGATWLGVGWWGSGCNERAKLWMIEKALNWAGIERIRFVVDALNHRSASAVINLGAHHIAHLRGDRVCHDGRSRDVNVFLLDRIAWENGGRSRLVARISKKKEQFTTTALQVAARERFYSIVEIPYQATHDLRHEVLRPDQPRDSINYPEDGDTGTLHLGVVTRGFVVGVASFYSERAPANGIHDADIRLRGMAVRRDLQQLGIGRALICVALERLRADGARGLWCNARTSAASYYAKLGFVPFGDDFSLADIGMHRRMYFDLRWDKEHADDTRLSFQS